MRHSTSSELTFNSVHHGLVFSQDHRGFISSSVLLYVHRDHRDGELRMATSTFTQLLSSENVVLVSKHGA